MMKNTEEDPSCNFQFRPILPRNGGDLASGLRGCSALRAMMAAMEKSVARVLPSSATILEAHPSTSINTQFPSSEATISFRPTHRLSFESV